MNNLYNEPQTFNNQTPSHPSYAWSPKFSTYFATSS